MTIQIARLARGCMWAVEGECGSQGCKGCPYMSSEISYGPFDVDNPLNQGLKCPNRCDGRGHGWPLIHVEDDIFQGDPKHFTDKHMYYWCENCNEYFVNGYF